ncbi:MAG: HAMP domain-containing protein [Candidatus Omnitrophica bacterium]|nr:HAMP domain-containing protein [Candidatus Omnitrophota bacterium]
MSRAGRATLALSFWHLGLLAVVLCLFGWVLYARVATSLARDVDQLLALQAEGIAGAVFAFREAEAGRHGASVGNWLNAPAGSLLGETQRGQLPDLLNRWAHKTEVLGAGRPFRLIDRAGAPILASDDFRALEAPLTPAVLAEALGRRTAYETFRRQGQRIRVVTYPVLEHRRVLYLIQTAASLRSADATVARMGFWLLWLIPLTLALTTLVGWLLATKTARLITLLASQAQRISAQHLETRLHVPGTGGEVERLTVTLNEMLARLERGFRQLRQFSAAASHELRTPLTALRGELEVTLRRPRSPEEYERVLRMHLQKAEEMSATVDELLRLAYTEAADRMGEWCPVELCALAREILETWQLLAAKVSTQLTLVAEAPVWIQGERRLLERVVSNLVDNAVKHSPPGGRVTMTVGRDGSQATVAVRDRGPGIPPEEVPTLFDRFFRGHRPSPPGVPSTGLGLGLCRWIAEVHRGGIDVSSAPRDGTTFTVRLPLAAAPVSAQPIPA